MTEQDLNFVAHFLKENFTEVSVILGFIWGVLRLFRRLFTAQSGQRWVLTLNINLECLAVIRSSTYGFLMTLAVPPWNTGTSGQK